MNYNSRIVRIWSDLTGLALPLVVIVLYIVDGPSTVTMALTWIFLGTVFGTWLVTTDLRRWRAARIARARRLWRRIIRVRA
jgi:hypothetical protein